MARYEFVTDDNGISLFRKHDMGAPNGCFRAEAECLTALAATGTVRTPSVINVSDRELLTERIECGQATSEGWRQLGAEMGALHAIPQPCFGFSTDNFCGATPQPNPQLDDGYAFFAEHRLGYQGRLALDAGLLDTEHLEGLARLGRRLPELVPEQGPALLHGDLWNGNVLFDSAGRPVVIDPACYWGWPEADIAMCALFGGFPETFFQAWEESWGPEPGWRDRLPLYQLYHMLNHLNLFGGGYRAQALAILSRFS
ncbi:MAG: fructosamine kinase family protein [Halieaceae bacterium]|nr:fructosamine kinase family protein [Halieaceae bacterium]